MLNGGPIDITEAPFAVMIHATEALSSIHGLVCGGSIIGRRYILTAAHCLGQLLSDYETNYDYKWLRVIAGINGHQCGVRTYEILYAYIHPDYTGQLDDAVNNRADIAVLKVCKCTDEESLKDRIIYRSTQSRIELTNYEPPNRAEGVIYGWGETEINATSPSSTLQKSVQTVYKYEVCKNLDPHFGYVADEMCMQGNPGTSSCYGDSGGPLVVDGKIVGIMSNAYECGNPEPAAVTNVAYYKPWIEDIIRGIAGFKTLPFLVRTGNAPPSNAESQ
ncbi:trypsin-like [Diachasmimorpha longicaudata]|uniref:trypsin-like n=1 Tax=Diachasmimorpha longicaudata TaxID=58733 RepID=UPI0030B8AC88